mgnify:CR=1 FL=1
MTDAFSSIDLAQELTLALEMADAGDAIAYAYFEKQNFKLATDFCKNSNDYKKEINNSYKSQKSVETFFKQLLKYSNNTKASSSLRLKLTAMKPTLSIGSIVYLFNPCFLVLFKALSI